MYGFPPGLLCEGTNIFEKWPQKICTSIFGTSNFWWILGEGVPRNHVPHTGPERGWSLCISTAAAGFGFSGQLSLGVSLGEMHWCYIAIKHWYDAWWWITVYVSLYHILPLPLLGLKSCALPGFFGCVQGDRYDSFGWQVGQMPEAVGALGNLGGWLMGRIYFVNYLNMFVKFLSLVRNLKCLIHVCFWVILWLAHRGGCICTILDTNELENSFASGHCISCISWKFDETGSAWFLVADGR